MKKIADINFSPLKTFLEILKERFPESDYRIESTPSCSGGNKEDEVPEIYLDFSIYSKTFTRHNERFASPYDEVFITMWLYCGFYSVEEESLVQLGLVVEYPGTDGFEGKFKKEVLDDDEFIRGLKSVIGQKDPYLEDTDLDDEEWQKKSFEWHKKLVNCSGVLSFVEDTSSEEYLE